MLLKSAFSNIFIVLALAIFSLVGPILAHTEAMNNQTDSLRQPQVTATDNRHSESQLRQQEQQKNDQQLIDKTMPNNAGTKTQTDGRNGNVDISVITQLDEQYQRPSYVDNSHQSGHVLTIGSAAVSQHKPRQSRHLVDTVNKPACDGDGWRQCGGRPKAVQHVLITHVSYVPTHVYHTHVQPITTTVVRHMSVTSVVTYTSTTHTTITPRLHLSTPSLPLTVYTTHVQHVTPRQVHTMHVARDVTSHITWTHVEVTTSMTHELLTSTMPVQHMITETVHQHVEAPQPLIISTTVTVTVSVPVFKTHTHYITEVNFHRPPASYTTEYRASYVTITSPLRPHVITVTTPCY